MRTETAAPTKEKHMETTENILNAFTFEGTSIATVTDEDQNIWVSANEVCAVLGYVNPRDAIGRHCRPKGVVKRDTLTEGGVQEVTYINEGNMYRLISRSKLPNAEAFELWVFDDVLPSIRKNGYYAMESKLALCHKEIARLLDANAAERARVTQPARLAEAKTEALAHKKEIKALEADTAASIAYAASLRANDAVVENEELRKLKRHLQAELRRQNEMVEFLQRKLQEAYASEVS